MRDVRSYIQLLEPLNELVIDTEEDLRIWLDDALGMFTTKKL